MKTIFVSVFCVLCSLIVLNCNTINSNTPQNTNYSSQVHREWMLTAFGSYSKADLIAKNAKINLTEKPENGKIRGTAFMGCNSMFFTSEFNNDGKVKISDVGSTLKACQHMKLEMDFSKAFRNITTYSVKGHSLTLTDDQGNRMEFIAADWD
ncbi:META domain-containing protein [Chryseobacterium hispalense]|uniref:META domain-containing protein n=1 Tax=Chryseobacterium hispalense TaxID=1453492 RepID=UPI0004930952|nr:META domain-containing protein [Chryseobacterium hispalense]